jgi:hypothetical protein
MSALPRASFPRSSWPLGLALVALAALGCAGRAGAPGAPSADPSDATDSAGWSDPRDVTRPGAPPPRYRASSNGPLVAITRNAYGAYDAAPNAPQLGDVVADFELPLARGGTFSLADARARGPVILVFYRGFW